MAITSTDIQNQSFSIDRKGYDVDEVDVFLERLCDEVDALNGQIGDLHEQVRDANLRAEEAEAQAAAAALASTTVREPVVETPAPEPKEYSDGEKDERIASLERQLEERRRDVDAIAQALITAQRSGEEIVANAKQAALRTQQEAEEEAKRILDKANAEKQRIIGAIAELQTSREQTRADYQDMLRGFISSATQVLTDLGDAADASSDSTGIVIPGVNDAACDGSAISDESLAATYTTPQSVRGRAVAPQSVTPSKPGKDLTGFGDAADDFEFDDID